MENDVCALREWTAILEVEDIAIWFWFELGSEGARKEGVAVQFGHCDVLAVLLIISSYSWPEVGKYLPCLLLVFLLECGLLF